MIIFISLEYLPSLRRIYLTESRRATRFSCDFVIVTDAFYLILWQFLYMRACVFFLHFYDMLIMWYKLFLNFVYSIWSFIF